MLRRTARSEAFDQHTTASQDQLHPHPVPHGGLDSMGVIQPGAEVALNPQPLPPGGGLEGFLGWG